MNPSAPPPHASYATFNTVKDVYIGGLPHDIDEKELGEKFQKFGKIVSLVIKPGGYAFIRYADEGAVPRAIDGWNNRKFRDYTLRVEHTRPKHPHPHLGGVRGDRGSARGTGGGGGGGAGSGAGGFGGGGGVGGGIGSGPTPQFDVVVRGACCLYAQEAQSSPGTNSRQDRRDK